MNLLDQIIASKKIQVAKEKSHTPLSFWEKEPGMLRKPFSLKQSLNDPYKSGIIAEFKRRSPSKGVINETVLVPQVTVSYTQHGAAGLSVLTDTLYFGGTNQDLKDARINDVPILRKDFVIDEYQVVQSKAIGADVILLIAACLSKQQVKNLARLAKELGMEILLEVHEISELEHISEDIQLVGVNNRDLKSFSVDIQRSMDLALELKKNIKNKYNNDLVLIAESGISDIQTIEKLSQAGYKGFLIGEYFMKQKDPGKAFARFVDELNVIHQKRIVK